jgi:pyruvate formate lyase activating enzyme
VRYNQDGRLFVPFGYVAGLQLDPVEKKPFFHVLPGASALSFGMVGCDLHCPYCQNWDSSQFSRDPLARVDAEEITAAEIVDTALRRNARILTSTYNEPLITAEWAAEVFSLAHSVGLLTSFVSNGNGTPEVIEYMSPRLDLIKIDLKAFRQQSYAKFGGVLQNVLDTIRLVKEKGKWLEIVTLLVPGLNDSEEELRDIAGFIASVSVEIPWHITAFHRDYKMTGGRDTTAEDLLKAVRIGREAGISFVYAGNLPGRSGRHENTYCPKCDSLLIERFGFRIVRNLLTAGNTCFSCGTTIPGVFA